LIFICFRGVCGGKKFKGLRLMVHDLQGGKIEIPKPKKRR
jgi:hypothetical protein